MAKLIYSAITSLDGYVADDEGNFDWAEPDGELHLFVNDLERSVGTYLYGRRMYETMVFWETAHTLDDQPQYVLDYAGIWQRAEKIVYSTTLASVSSVRTRIEREFDPGAVREMKASLTNDISVGGPRLAAQAFKVGLVDAISSSVPLLWGVETRPCRQMGAWMSSSLTSGGSEMESFTFTIALLPQSDRRHSAGARQQPPGGVP